jgi:hypothetical protein
MKKSELQQIIKEEIIKEMESNTSKIFNLFWSDHESAKQINKRIKEMDDDELLRLLDNEPLSNNLNTPRKIQVALMRKEAKRRGLEIT